MAKTNYNTLALASLGYTIADLRNPNTREEIQTEAARLEAANRRTRETDTISQARIMNVLFGFDGFNADPTLYGPTVTEVHARLVEEGANVKRNAVAQHLSKLRAGGVIDSARMLEAGPQGGAPAVFFFCVDETSANNVADGSLRVRPSNS